MKIAIVTVGTRGDVQPYVAVGKALAARGHEVWLAAHDEFAPLIRAHGLGHRTMRGSMRALLDTDLGRAWLTSGDSPRRYAKCARELFAPYTRAWCEDADAAAEGADALAFYAVATGGLYAAERRRLPVVALAPFPFVPTGDFAPMAGRLVHHAPRFVKRAFGRFVPKIAFGPFNDAHQDYRASVGLTRYSSSNPLSYVVDSSVPVLHLFSETFLPRPNDWATRHRVTGCAFLDEDTYIPPDSLVRFLEKPAIYVGFGSMTGVDPDELSATVAKAIRLAGVRAVVAKGWAGLSPKPSDELLLVDEVPHGWLFPRVTTVVHHGGAGTMAEGMRAGRPTVIAAFFGDQPFWGQVNERAGTGPRALARSTLTAERLATAIVAAERHRLRAEEIGRALRAEAGAERAADAMLEVFARAPQGPAVWA